MEREDESQSQVAVEVEAAEEQSGGQGRQADSKRSDGEALALHEI
jgi:hypothetical protein